MPAFSEGGAVVESMQFSTDWFGHNIPHWERWLGSLRGKPGLRVLEIGCFEGRSTQWLCHNMLTAPDSSIDCLDFFAVDPVYGNYHERFRANTKPWRNQIREFPGSSFDSLKRLSGLYDLVYIDGWHSAFGVLADGVMTWPLLKVGGVMIFDDYLWVPPRLGSPPRPGFLKREWIRLTGRDWRSEGLKKQIESVKTETVKLGVDGLLATLEGYYDLLGVSNQLAVRKTRDFSRGQVGHDT